MILKALVQQITLRFQHEKRAQICLWFDEKQEFLALLPALRSYLAEMTPAPFVLLEYDPRPDVWHGQIWLKHRVCSEQAELSAQERRKRRFLIYLPLAEDRLDAPDVDGRHHLELLAEYRLAGVLWRVAGKRPTLFSFLRQAGVELPASPAEQRKLYDGGRESLLAKYVAKFADRPADYWRGMLTVKLVQSRLLGDADQTILDLAVDPQATWLELREKGLDRDLFEAVEERYGFTCGTESPASWIRELVAALALTETFLGYGEPEDFPFADRLPPAPLRTHHQELLRRWLRDSESRAAWDRRIREVETRIDLTGWAAERSGLSFGFPHLVRQRWERTLVELEQAAPKASTTAAFFEAHGERIREEAEFAKASHAPAGSWTLLHKLHTFLDACRAAESEVLAAGTVGKLARLYVERAPVIERAHIEIRRDAEGLEHPALAQVADSTYARYANALNDRFFERYAEQADAEIAGIPHVTGKLEKALWHAEGRRAVLIVDALRYDCGHAVGEALRGHEVRIEPMRATLPTITPIGMTALLPISSAQLSLDVKANYPHPKLAGKDASQRGNRLAFLRDFGADCREIEELESVSEPPENFGDLLVVVGHDEVDHIGHGSAEKLIRHLDPEIERVARLVRKLHRWGYETVHVVTDHGFLLLDESKLPELVACDKDWCRVRKERYALIPATADVPLVSFPFAWDAGVRVAIPPGLAFFKAEKSFSHGGATLQELIIPHLVSRRRAFEEKRIEIEVVLPARELMGAAVKVGLRPVPAAATGAQMPLFGAVGRTLSLDVFGTSAQGKRESVLAAPKAKEVRLEAGDAEKSVTLFLRTLPFRKGEVVELDIRDVETSEQLPPGGIKLTFGRDL
ncbi:MAG: PglZ domain-containing protein [bacterium]|nr:PglZ domain-containing protein [bacterium]